MRVLVTSFPGKGHFHPIAPLALALAQTGHEVRVATGPDLVPWVRACGLVAVPAGRSEAELVADAAGLAVPDRSVRLFTTLSVPAFAADALALADRWRPDLVVNEEGEHAGPLIAAKLGVPSATHSWPAPALPPSTRAALADALQGIWQDYGLEGPPRISGDHYLDCCPPPLQTPDIEAIDGVTSVRPSLFDGPPIDPHVWLDQLVEPIVLVTLGTVPLFAPPELIRLLVESVIPIAGTVVATTGPHPETVLPPHPRLRVCRYMPLSAILPKAALVVSHGGASTAVACLLTGVPHLIVPQGAPSQHRIANSITALGIGQTITNEQLDPRTIVAAAKEQLQATKVRDRIAAIRRALKALPGPEDVARYLAHIAQPGDSFSGSPFWTRNHPEGPAGLCL